MSYFKRMGGTNLLGGLWVSCCLSLGLKFRVCKNAKRIKIHCHKFSHKSLHKEQTSLADGYRSLLFHSTACLGCLLCCTIKVAFQSMLGQKHLCYLVRRHHEMCLNSGVLKLLSFTELGLAMGLKIYWQRDKQTSPSAPHTAECQ